MSVREFIGGRYIPIIVGEWDNTRTYEPLMVVTYQGASYTSRQYVPVGIEITNENYWVLSANYNAQIEAYRNEVRDILPYDEAPTEGSSKGVTSDGIEKAISKAVSTETVRATNAETVNADAITHEVTRATNAETVNANAIALNTNKLSVIYPFDAVPTKGSTKGITSAGVYEALSMVGNVYARPEDYGAAGDGTTDDTKAIQDAINANNCVCLGSGKRYLVASTINLKPNLTIIGANRDSTILLSSTAQIVLPSNSTANYGLQLIGFTIRTNGTRTNTAIVLNDMVYSLLDNLCVRSDDGVDNRNGLLIQKADFTYPAFANVVRNCFFQRAAFYLKDSTDNVISGNKFWANDMSANAVKLQGNCNNNCFEGNHLITTNEYTGFDAEIGVNNLRFTNNYFDGCKNGMFVSLLVTSSIIGNHFYNNSIRPFAVNYMRGCSFTDNMFTDCCTSEDSKAIGDVVLLQESYANVFKGNTHYRSKAPNHNTPAYVITNNPTSSSNLVCDTSLMYPYSYYTASKKAQNCVYDNCYPQDMFNAN